MGALVDAWFPQYIRFAAYLKSGIIITDGIATIGDGSRVEGILKLVEQRTDTRSYSIVEFTDSDGGRVPRSHIKNVKFLAWDFEDIKTVIPGIAKIAYSSIHYLLNYKHHRFEYRNFVNRRQLEGLRLLFNRDVNRRTSTSYKDITIAAKNHEELIEIIQRFDNPETRRHFILLRQNGKDIELLIILLSQYLWKVSVHDCSLPIGVRELQEESLLHELNKLNLKNYVSHNPYGEKHEKIYVHVANPAFGK